MTTIQLADGRMVQEEEYNKVVSEVEESLKQHLTPSVWEYLPNEMKNTLIQSDLEKRGWKKAEPLAGGKS